MIRKCINCGSTLLEDEGELCYQCEVIKNNVKIINNILEHTNDQQQIGLLEFLKSRELDRYYAREVKK
jgi:hypothetical protein